MSLALQHTAQGIAFWIHVSPRAKREGVGGVHGDALKVVTKAPPVDGEANASCVQLLAEALAIPRKRVLIDAGSTGRRKRVHLVAADKSECQKLEASLHALANSKDLR